MPNVVVFCWPSCLDHNADQAMLHKAMAIQECKACHEAKPLTEYYRSVTNRDGLVSKCKRCMAQSNQRKVSPCHHCLQWQLGYVASKAQLLVTICFAVPRLNSDTLMTDRLLAPVDHQDDRQYLMSGLAAASSIFWCLVLGRI